MKKIFAIYFLFLYFYKQFNLNRKPKQGLFFWLENFKFENLFKFFERKRKQKPVYFNEARKTEFSWAK